MDYAVKNGKVIGFRLLFISKNAKIVMCGKRIYRRKGEHMLNYEEELAKFQPCLEIDEAEDAILHNDLTDISDIIETILKSGK